MDKDKILSNVFEELKEQEGIVLHPYKDINGILTIGIGTRIDKIPYELAKCMAKFMLKGKYDGLLTQKPIIKELPQPIVEVLLNMAYNLGVNGVLKFKRMWQAIENKDWNNMIKEMYDSLWYQKDPARVNALVRKVRKFMGE